MTQQAELLKKIENLPQKYYGEVIDFVVSLQQKHIDDVAENQNDDEIAGYQAMAADTEREEEAREWCNAYFGPARQ